MLRRRVELVALAVTIGLGLRFLAESVLSELEWTLWLGVSGHGATEFSHLPFFAAGRLDAFVLGGLAGTVCVAGALARGSRRYVQALALALWASSAIVLAQGVTHELGNPWEQVAGLAAVCLASAWAAGRTDALLLPSALRRSAAGWSLVGACLLGAPTLADRSGLFRAAYPAFRLELRIVIEDHGLDPPRLGSGERFVPWAAEAVGGDSEPPLHLAAGGCDLTEANVVLVGWDATPEGEELILLRLEREIGGELLTLTRHHLGDRLAIVHDERVLFAPTIRSAIRDWVLIEPGNSGWKDSGLGPLYEALTGEAPPH